MISNVSREKLLEAVLDKIDYNVKYFKTFVPLQSNDITDQYFFDVYLYVLYTEAGKFIKSSEDRVKLRQMVGEGVLFLLYRNYNISIPKAVDSSYAAASLGTKSTILSKKVDQLGPGIRQILEAFKATGVISGFSFDEEDLVDEKYAFSSFSEGLPVSFQVHYPHHLKNITTYWHIQLFYYWHCLCSGILLSCQRSHTVKLD